MDEIRSITFTLLMAGFTSCSVAWLLIQIDKAMNSDGSYVCELVVKRVLNFCFHVSNIF